MPIAPFVALAALTLADPPQAPAPIDVVSALETTLADAIERARPSIVAIVRRRSQDGEETTAVRGRNPVPPEDLDPNGRPRFPGMIEFEEVALPGDFGSGVVIGEKGEILTVYHILRGAGQIRVYAAGRPPFEAEIIAADPRTDLAVIVPRESPHVPAPKLRPLPIGDASKLRVGSFLCALGNPYNGAKDGQASASWGILANIARKFYSPKDDRSIVGQFRFRPTLLQLDAKLNLGMSGGAVINLKGELVGITTAAGGAAGFDAQAGYAIPMDPLGRRAVEALRQGKEVEYAFLGISLSGLLANQIGGVEPNTPAAQGKLLQDDLILEVGGVPVVGPDGLALALAAAAVGKPVPIKVLRNGETIETSVVASKYPMDEKTVIATNRPKPWRGLRVDYSSVLGGNTSSNEILKAMAKGNVGIVEVEAGSPADLAGLKRGQFITKVNGKSVKSPDEFARVVAGLRGPATLETDLGPVEVREPQTSAAR